MYSGLSFELHSDSPRISRYNAKDISIQKASPLLGLIQKTADVAYTEQENWNPFQKVRIWCSKETNNFTSS